MTATRGTGRYRLYGAKGSGAMIVEVAFARANVPVEFVDLAWDDIGWNTRTLAPLNPLGQVPTLAMPDVVMSDDPDCEAAAKRNGF